MSLTSSVSDAVRASAVSVSTSVSPVVIVLSVER